MQLSAAVEQQYVRLAGQRQVLYAYWLSVGDVPRARLAMDVANWYYQQLGWPLYLPSDFPGYAPQPTDPEAAVALDAALPATNANLSAAVPAAGTDRSAVGGSRAGAATDSGSLTTAAQQSRQKALLEGFGGGTGDSPYADFCVWFPDDPYCGDFGFSYWGGTGGSYGASGGGGGTTVINAPVTIVINQQGLTLGDVSSRISGALGAAAAAIATAVDSALRSAISGIQHALNALGNELISVYKLLSRLAGYILNFLKGLLLDVIHGLVAAVQAIGRMLKDVFQNVLIPALKALQRLRNYLIKIYERYLRRLLIVLQDVRKVLAILRAFHVGFATKLDNVLADIQAKISGPLLYLLGYVNAVANYINLILDPRLFIQKPLFLASLNAYKGSTLNLLINSMNPPADQHAIDALIAAADATKPKNASLAFDQCLQTHTGQIAFDIAGPSLEFDQLLKQGFM